MRATKFSIKKEFFPIEIISFIYMAITAVFILLFWNLIKDGTAGELLLTRLFFIAVIGGLYWINKYTNAPIVPVLRQIIPLGFIIHFYPETYYFNNVIFAEYLDPTFIHLDQIIFGTQPSTVFSEIMPYAWFNELMNFAYCTYFFTIAGIVFYLLFRNKDAAFRATFIMLCSFFIYYILFIILPVAGPQFYVFDHDTALPSHGPMRELLLFFHAMGEQPTGAVPSSHIGIMTIYMTLLWQNGRKLFWWILPLSFLLMLSTVYIRAHYAVDVLLGFATAPFIFLFSNWCWKKFNEFNRCKK